MPDYNMLFQAPNAGAAFSQGFQQAQENRQRQMQMQYQLQRQQQADQRQSQQDHMQALEAHRENIVRGAQIIRQINPKDDASWQQAKALAAQAGIDVSEVPDHYDPQYVQGISAIADAFEPQKQANAPNSYEEYQRAQQDPNYAKFLDERKGPLIANNGDGTFTIIPRSGGQAAPQASGPQPGHVEDGYVFKGGNPSDPNAWQKVGGSTASAPSSTFP